MRKSSNNMVRNKEPQSKLLIAPINPATLDELDFAILVLLQKDGRMSFTELASELNVSISNVRNRFNKLIEEKTIQIIGRVNPEKVGFHAYAHIKISVRPATLIDSVATQLMKLPEISFMAITSGEYDLVVDMMCRDNDHLLQIVNNWISKIDGVYHTRTDMYFKVLKFAQPDLKLLQPNSSDAT